MSVARLPAVIPFDEIVPGATVRFCVKDGAQYLSIRDMIMCVCGKDPHDAAQIWRRMSPERLSEIGTLCSNFHFPGQGQSEQPVITFGGALKLIMFLPGEAAKTYRGIMSDILRRYYAGDASLMDEVITNNKSDSPVNEMARASLLADGGEDGGRIEDDAESRKRKREAVELFKMEVDAQLALWNGKMAMIDKYKALATDKGLDADTRGVFKKALRETAGAGQAVAVCNEADERHDERHAERHDEPDADVDTTDINVVDMAEELGVELNKARLRRVDGVMLNHYLKKYKRCPERATVYRHGEDVELNLYYETDRGVMERALLGAGGPKKGK
jgi:hypothetical protein